MKQLIFSFKENHIKAALVEKSGNAYDVLGGGSVELSQGSIEAGVIKNYDEVKEKLQNLVGSLSAAKSHQILILLSEEATFLKVIKDSEEKEILENPKIQEEIPYPLAGSFSTLRLLKNKNIQLLATPREVVSDYQKLFRDLGLGIESIFPEPIIFLPHLEKTQRPTLVISAEGGSILFSVIHESGIFFSTTKHFKEGVFDQNKLTGWVKEIIDQEIKTISPTLDFEALVFGEKETEIFEELQKSKILTRILNVTYRKVNPQLGDISGYKRLVIAAGLNKQLPGFHVKGTKFSSGEKSRALPKINFKLVIAGLLGFVLIGGILWYAPKISELLLSARRGETTQTSQPQPIATPSAQATSSAKKDDVPEKPKVEEKKEEPKPVLKRSSLKIEVLNGSGVPGTAFDATTFLEGKGYSVTETGNASNFNFSKTEIRLKKSKESFRTLLTKDLGERYTIIKGAALEENSSFDSQVIIGKQ